jgi:outer membrane protein assembly factor BamB
MIFATTTNGCGGVPNGVWAMDLSAESPKAISWTSAGNPAGLAFDAKGTMFAAIGAGAAASDGRANSVVALDPKTLEVKDWFFGPDASFTTGPTVFSYNDHELIAAATKDGRIFLLSSASLGGTDHRTALYTSTPSTKSTTWSPSALSTWEDAAKNRFILLPAVGEKGRIVAYRLAATSANPGLQQVWSTDDLGTPSAPIVVNGVMFVVKAGSPSSPAVLYAFDALSGKELWNSGKSITSYVRSIGIWSSNAQVYVATHDSTVYAFGFAMDRHL